MPVKILYFVDRMLHGGIQTMIYNYTKNTDLSKVCIDYLLLDDGGEYPLENKLKKRGCKIYKLSGVWIEKPFDYIPYCKKMNAFFSAHNNYDIIHMHSSSKNFLVLYFARKYGIKVRIAHAHAVEFQSDSFLKKMTGKLFNLFLRRLATHCFACSKAAGKWMFGEKIVRDGRVKYIHNAINIKEFLYNENIRYKIRKKLNLERNFVIGHVGRFIDQKNHKFLIRVFLRVCKYEENARLVLIGKGKKENMIKKW